MQRPIGIKLIQFAQRTWSVSDGKRTKLCLPKSKRTQMCWPRVKSRNYESGLRATGLHGQRRVSKKEQFFAWLNGNGGRMPRPGEASIVTARQVAIESSIANMLRVNRIGTLVWSFSVGTPRPR